MEQISKYNWLKYQQLPEEHLWLVIRLFRGEYVVFLYNSEDDSHYNAVYFGKNKRGAEYKYQRKLAYYRRTVRENQPKSLAQKLAEEMGWEIVVD